MNDIVIIGSGGFAKEVVFLVKDINKILPNEEKYTILGYVDTKDKIGSQNGEYAVIMDDEDLASYGKPINVASGIGSPKLSNLIFSKITQNKNLLFPNLVHPSSIGDWKRIKMGQGNIICANSVFTTDIEIKDFNIFNLSCTVGHDVKIGSYNIFNPTVNVSGGVEIDDRNLIGTGAQILQYLSIGSGVSIGAGAVVVKHANDEGVYVGIPAKTLKTNPL